MTRKASLTSDRLVIEHVPGLWAVRIHAEDPVVLRPCKDKLSPQRELMLLCCRIGLNAGCQLSSSHCQLASARSVP